MPVYGPCGSAQRTKRAPAPPIARAPYRGAPADALAPIDVEELPESPAGHEPIENETDTGGQIEGPRIRRAIPQRTHAAQKLALVRPSGDQGSAAADIAGNG